MRDFLEGLMPWLVGNLLKVRLRGLISERGETAREVSKRATGKPDTIRDILRDKTRNPRTDTLQKIATALEVDLAYLTGASAMRRAHQGAMPGGLIPVRVVGFVQAGAFMEMHAADALADEPQYIAAVEDRDFPKLTPIAFEVVGDSINLQCEPGGYALCVPFAETGLQLKEGMWVVAERQRGDMIERTIKKVVQAGRRFELHPASTNPVHKPIRFPSAEAHEEVRVVALVRRFIGPALPL